MEQNSFLFQALVFLAAAVLFVPIAKRLGLGSVLGYLLAGIIIGPFVLGFIGEEGTDIMHYAEFGVVMMLFLIGLELEPPLLWKLRRSIIGLGSLQVILTAIVISAVAMDLAARGGARTDPGAFLHGDGDATVAGKRTDKNGVGPERIRSAAVPGHCRDTDAGTFSFACHLSAGCPGTRRSA